MKASNKEANAPPGVRVSLYMPVEMVSRLDDLAWRKRKSRSEVVREIIEKKLEAEAKKS